MINLSADEWEFFQKFYTETGPVLPPEGNGWEIVNIAGIAFALSNEAKKTMCSQVLWARKREGQPYR